MDRRTKSSEYRKYLLSERWRLKRFKAIWAAGAMCERCKSRVDLEVHHLSYENFGNEFPWQLQVLCKQCHKAEHLKKNRGVHSA
jgi:5-methylcytosine-specific restriction endonuclease McrA